MAVLVFRVVFAFKLEYILPHLTLNDFLEKVSYINIVKQTKNLQTRIVLINGSIKS